MSNFSATFFTETAINIDMLVIMKVGTCRSTDFLFRTILSETDVTHFTFCTIHVLMWVEKKQNRYFQNIKIV